MCSFKILAILFGFVLVDHQVQGTINVDESNWKNVDIRRKLHSLKSLHPSVKQVQGVSLSNNKGSMKLLLDSDKSEQSLEAAKTDNTETAERLEVENPFVFSVPQESLSDGSLASSNVALNDATVRKDAENLEASERLKFTTGKNHALEASMKALDESVDTLHRLSSLSQNILNEEGWKEQPKQAADRVFSNPPSSFLAETCDISAKIVALENAELKANLDALSEDVSTQKKAKEAAQQQLQAAVKKLDVANAAIQKLSVLGNDASSQVADTKALVWYEVLFGDEYVRVLLSILLVVFVSSSVLAVVVWMRRNIPARRRQPDPVLSTFTDLEPDDDYSERLSEQSSDGSRSTAVSSINSV